MKVFNNIISSRKTIFPIFKNFQVSSHPKNAHTAFESLKWLITQKADPDPTLENAFHRSRVLIVYTFLLLKFNITRHYLMKILDKDIKLLVVSVYHITSVTNGHGLLKEFSNRLHFKHCREFPISNKK